MIVLINTILILFLLFIFIEFLDRCLGGLKGLSVHSVTTSIELVVFVRGSSTFCRVLLLGGISICVSVSEALKQLSELFLSHFPVDGHEASVVVVEEKIVSVGPVDKDRAQRLDLHTISYVSESIEQHLVLNLQISVLGQ